MTDLSTPSPELFDANGMPIFDKTRLLSEEFAQYLYTLEFKAKNVTDMTVGGYQAAIRPYMDGGYTTELLATHVMGGVIYCQVRVTIKLLSGVTFESFGDADNRSSPDGDTCLRTAESRAFKRTVTQALNIAPVDFRDAKVAASRGRGSHYEGAAERLARRETEQLKGVDLAVISPMKTPPPSGVNPAGAKGVWERCL